MMTSSAVFFVFLPLTLLLITASSDLYDDRNALIAFITSINVTHTKYKWDKYPSSIGPCEWTGVECGPENSAVVRLSIPGASLLGSIREGTLGKITSLRVLSLRHNGLSGPLPSDFAHLTELRKVILNNNNFSGVELSSSLANWTNLKILDVSNNNFTGTIPSTTNFNRIIHFNLSNNNFSGILPDSFPSTLKSENFSVSNNNLSGPIPSTLASFPLFAFSKNFDLCDKPLSKTCDKRKYPPPPPPSKKKPKKLSTGAIVAIAVGSALILLILLLCLGNKLSRALKEKKEPVVATMAAEAAAKAKNERGSGGGVEAGTSSSKDDVTGVSHHKTK